MNKDVNITTNFSQVDLSLLIPLPYMIPHIEAFVKMPKLPEEVAWYGFVAYYSGHLHVVYFFPFSVFLNY